jgi:hypothetical protein
MFRDGTLFKKTIFLLLTGKSSSFPPFYLLFNNGMFFAIKKISFNCASKIITEVIGTFYWQGCWQGNVRCY